LRERHPKKNVCFLDANFAAEDEVEARFATLIVEARKQKNVTMLFEEKLSVINKLDALYKSKLGLEYMLRAFDQQDPKMVQNVKDQVQRTEKEIELYSKIRETLNDSIRELEADLKIDEKQTPELPIPKSSSRIAFSLFNYNAVEPNHLPLKKGDRIELLDCTDDDWWFGRLATGAEGIHSFPNFTYRLLPKILCSRNQRNRPTI
jgi:hypothetical protein